MSIIWIRSTNLVPLREHKKFLSTITRFMAFFINIILYSMSNDRTRKTKKKKKRLQFLSVSMNCNEPWNWKIRPLWKKPSLKRVIRLTPFFSFKNDGKAHHAKRSPTNDNEKYNPRGKNTTESYYCSIKESRACHLQ